MTEAHVCVNNLPRLHSTARRPVFELGYYYSRIFAPGIPNDLHIVHVNTTNPDHRVEVVGNDGCTECLSNKLLLLQYLQS